MVVNSGVWEDGWEGGVKGGNTGRTEGDGEGWLARGPQQIKNGMWEAG